MKFNLRLIALLIAMLMLLTSCESVIEPLLGLIPGLQTTTTTTMPKPKPPKRTTTTTTTGDPGDEEEVWKAEDHSITKNEMLKRYTLTREEVDAALTLLDDMLDASLNAETIEEVDAFYEQFEDVFYHIAQQMTVASIVYYCDMSDETASNRHLDTTDMFYEIQDKYTETCRSMYLESKFSAELFADWSEEEIQSLLDFDPKTTQLKKEVEELQVEYNNLTSAEFDEKTAEIYAKIVTKNNELARLYGYDNYYDYATENVYGRDYTAEDLKLFKEYVIKYIVPTFNVLYSGWNEIYDLAEFSRNIAIGFIQEPFDTLNKNYVIKYLDSLGDTNMGTAMRNVFDEKNCIFSYNSNSHPTAFQTYLYEDETPFCLFGSSGRSSNTLIHEIGHYYAAYTNNDIDNYDLCETHSQGNEYLFIQYSKGELSSKVYNVVRDYNLFNSYYTIVCASAVDSFEQRVYSLDSVEGYTAADFDKIMDEVLAEFGKTNKWFSDNLTDMHYYWKAVAVDNPVYYISYAVSAVAAVEIFAIAEEDYDAAIAAYTALVEGVTYEDGFIEALKKAGLYTPFEEETYKKVSKTMGR